MDLIKLNQFPNVSAGGVSTLVTRELQGMSVHALFFEMGGTTFTEANVDNVRIGLGGKELVEGITGVNLENINEYTGQVPDASYFAHWFGDPMARTIRGQHKGDLDLSIYNSPLEIEVEIAAGAVAPTLQVYALVGAPKMDMGIGFSQIDALMCRALIRSVVQPSAAVVRKSFEIGLGSEAGALIRAVHFFHTNLTSVEFKKQGRDKHDDISVALNSFMQKQFARVPAASHYVLDRVVDGNQGEAETTLRPDGSAWNYQVNLSTSALDTIYTYADVHTALQLI